MFVVAPLLYCLSNYTCLATSEVLFELTVRRMFK